MHGPGLPTKKVDFATVNYVLLTLKFVMVPFSEERLRLVLRQTEEKKYDIPWIHRTRHETSTKSCKVFSLRPMFYQ
jgi:hypothetical protein